jgi:hypothetical protein
MLVEDISDTQYKTPDARAYEYTLPLRLYNYIYFK